MTLEKIQSKYTPDGLTKLAVSEISFAKRAEKGKKADYKLKVAQLTMDLGRITDIAKELEYELPENVILEIEDLKIKHPDPTGEITEELSFKKYLR
jgi:hypothetical protein